LVYERSRTHEDSQFSTQMVFVVVRILNWCVMDCGGVYGLISLSSRFFLWFLICGLVRVLYLSLVVNF